MLPAAVAHVQDLLAAAAVATAPVAQRDAAQPHCHEARTP